MVWLWTHGNELLILFIFPLIGLGLDLLISNRRTVYTLIASLLLLAPILTGYYYIISWFYQIFALIALACIYSFYSRQIDKRVAKIISSVITSGLLFLILGWFAFMDSFSGFQKVENTWNMDGYKIEYIRDQGFAGKPLMKYELSAYAAIPIFIKRIETVRDTTSGTNCEITFTRSKLILNKCEGTLTPLP